MNILRSISIRAPLKPIIHPNDGWIEKKRLRYYVMFQRATRFTRGEKGKREGKERRGEKGANKNCPGVK